VACVNTALGSAACTPHVAYLSRPSNFFSPIRNPEAVIFVTCTVTSSFYFDGQKLYCADDRTILIIDRQSEGVMT